MAFTKSAIDILPKENTGKYSKLMLYTVGTIINCIYKLRKVEINFKFYWEYRNTHTHTHTKNSFILQKTSSMYPHANRAQEQAPANKHLQAPYITTQLIHLPSLPFTIASLPHKHIHTCTHIFVWMWLTKTQRQAHKVSLTSTKTIPNQFQWNKVSNSLIWLMNWVHSFSCLQYLHAILYLHFKSQSAQFSCQYILNVKW